MAGVLKDSLEVTVAYQTSAREKNYHFAKTVAGAIGSKKISINKSSLENLRKLYSLDALEYYPSLIGERVMLLTDEKAIPQIPPVTLELLKKGIKQRSEASTRHEFAEGTLLRVIVPIKGGVGAVVVSSYVPISLTSRMDDIAKAYEGFRGDNPVEFPLKSIYLIILVLMTLVILLGATWFGFYLAKQLSIPIEKLGEATKKIANREYEKVDVKTGSVEITELINHFNGMTDQLEHSEKEVRDANKSLQATLARLDEHTRYIEVVLSSISTGVVSVDKKGYITMINPHAAALLKIESGEYIGRHAKSVMSKDHFKIFTELLQKMRTHQSDRIQKEIRISSGGRTIPLQMTLNFLYDDSRRELGKVLVFDDLSPVLSAQRAAAWER